MSTAKLKAGSGKCSLMAIYRRILRVRTLRQVSIWLFCHPWGYKIYNNNNNLTYIYPHAHPPGHLVSTWLSTWHLWLSLGHPHALPHAHYSERLDFLEVYVCIQWVTNSTQSRCSRYSYNAGNVRTGEHLDTPAFRAKPFYVLRSYPAMFLIASGVSADIIHGVFVARRHA
jgi:hypothetical protein